MDKAKLIEAVKLLNAQNMKVLKAVKNEEGEDELIPVLDGPEGNMVDALNEEGKPTPVLVQKIKVVAVKEEALIANFKSACESLTPEQEASVPQSIADVYNKMFPQTETQETEPAVAPPDTDTAPTSAVATPKVTPKKKDAPAPAPPAPAPKPKPEKKAKEKIDKPAKGPGVIGTIYNMIANGPVSVDEIVEGLKVAFPDRDIESMKKTIRAQIGGSTPCRMEKEKGIKFVIDKDGKRSLAPVKKK